MTATRVDPAELAAEYRARVAESVQELGRELRIVGLLTQTDGPAETYARYAKSGAESVGISYDLRRLEPDQVVAAIAEANQDPGVDGIFLYYPMIDPTQDMWLRELVDPRKDIEGMHSFWSRCLYENRRYLDPEQQVKAILPCTPLAILKLLQYAGLPEGTGDGAEHPLRGITACVINRSDIVGRPLAAMLANDGASVFSFDVDGVQHFEPAIGRHAHSVRDSEITRAQALAAADAVITGVPTRDFELVRADEIKPGAICLNFSQVRNFDPDIVEMASAFIPRVGPMTVMMAARNLVRLRTSIDQVSGNAGG